MGLLVALIAFLALAISGGAGYFIGRASKQAATTGARVNLTVPYVQSSHIDPLVSVNGLLCAYSGPTEVKAGTVAHFTFAPTGDYAVGTSQYTAHSALLVAAVSSYTTWEQNVDWATTKPAHEEPPWSGGDISVQYGAGTMSAPLMTGLYWVSCATPPTGSDKAYPGTMLRVIGS